MQGISEKRECSENPAEQLSGAGAHLPGPSGPSFHKEVAVMAGGTKCD